MCLVNVVCLVSISTLGMVFSGGSFFEIKEMVESKIAQLDKMTFQCTECDYQSNRKANVARHVEGHHISNLSIACAYCSRLFASSNALNTHVSRKHRNSK